MQFEYILLAIATSYLRKLLQKKNQLPHFQPWLLVGFVLSIGLMAVQISSKMLRPYTVWVGHLLFIALVYFVYTRKEFEEVKSKAHIVLPLIVINFIGDVVNLISSSFYDDYINYFEVARTFAFIWLIVMLIISNRQTKALQKEREKAAEKERQFQVTEAMKQQLEVQVQERTAEILQQKHELEQTLLDLKAAQAQLVQSEKMASLGELTAGIAHEIQNPLNFVNNFSEVNEELIVELLEEMAKGNAEEVEAIAADIKQNLQKITHHGKRADGIVKGMLQHSRTGSGKKELTDLNALCDEYLRLAYHGLRAKDKSFNAKFEANLDAAVPKIELMPQDMGRVILNLINNAFYAVSERRKLEGDNFKPYVEVSTKKTDSNILVAVKDNGNGIPAAIKEKIFQPFFTTKPTGQGTGLGLSLAYDIIKAHGGELKVDSKEGVGTEFLIYLPL